MALEGPFDSEQSYSIMSKTPICPNRPRMIHAVHRWRRVSDREIGRDRPNRRCKTVRRRPCTSTKVTLFDGQEHLAARGNRSFKQHEVTRAVRGVLKTGLEVGLVEVDCHSGKIIISTPDKTEAATNAYDDWKKKNK